MKAKLIILEQQKLIYELRTCSDVHSRWTNKQKAQEALDIFINSGYVDANLKEVILNEEIPIKLMSKIEMDLNSGNVIRSENSLMTKFDGQISGEPFIDTNYNLNSVFAPVIIIYFADKWKIRSYDGDLISCSINSIDVDYKTNLEKIENFRQLELVRLKNMPKLTCYNCKGTELKDFFSKNTMGGTFRTNEGILQNLWFCSDECHAEYSEINQLRSSEESEES